MKPSDRIKELVREHMRNNCHPLASPKERSLAQLDALPVAICQWLDERFADQPAPTETKCQYHPIYRECSYCGGAMNRGDDLECPGQTPPQGAPRRILGGKGGQTVGLEPHWRGCRCEECTPQGAPYECNCPAPYPEAVHDLTCPEHLKRFPEDAPQGAPRGTTET